MKVIFIRHNMSSTQIIRQQLWDQGKIALHYDDKLSANPDDWRDYPAARKALRKLLAFCKEGVYVGLVCRKLYPEKILIGELPKKSKVVGQLFIDGKKKFGYKIASLKNYKPVELINYPVLGALQPRQGTITGWPSASNIIRAIIKGKNLPLELSSLHPSLLEVLCYEYMKEKDLILVLLAPIGRSLNDIDIIGLNSKNQVIVSQVTHSYNKATIKDKVDRLNKYTSTNNNARPIMFGPKSVAQNNITYISIEDVFQYFHKSNNIVFKSMLNQMIGIV